MIQEIVPETYGLTMYAPYSDLLIAGIKLYETRPRGARCKFPVTLYIETAQEEMTPELRALANKYLGADYQPEYGKVIGVVSFDGVRKMTEDLINEQTPPGN